MSGINPYGVPLDALASPSDVTTLNATTSAHGLLKKLSGSTSEYLNGVGSWVTISTGSPSGSTKQVQYNNASSFGGATGFEYQSGASPNVLIVSQNAAYVPLCVKGTTSQSAFYIDIQNSSGTTVLAVESTPRVRFGTSGEYLYIYPTVGSAISNIEAQAHLYLRAANTVRFFHGGTKYYDFSSTELAIVNGSISLGDSSSLNIIKRNATDPIGVNGNSITTPLWITGVDGFPGNTANARHALDINISLGGGGSPSSGPVTGGNAAKLNVILRAGGTGNGAADGSAGQFRVWDGTTNFFRVEHGAKIGFYTATPVVQQVLATGGGATVDNVITFLQLIGLCKQS